MAIVHSYVAVYQRLSKLHDHNSYRILLSQKDYPPVVKHGGGTSLKNISKKMKWPWTFIAGKITELNDLLGGFKHEFYIILFSISYMGSSFPLTFIFFKMVIVPPTSDYKMGEFPGSHV